MKDSNLDKLSQIKSILFQLNIQLDFEKIYNAVVRNA